MLMGLQHCVNITGSASTESMGVINCVNYDDSFYTSLF